METSSCWLSSPLADQVSQRERKESPQSDTYKGHTLNYVIPSLSVFNKPLEFFFETKYPLIPKTSSSQTSFFLSFLEEKKKSPTPAYPTHTGFSLMDTFGLQMLLVYKGLNLKSTSHSYSIALLSKTVAYRPLWFLLKTVSSHHDEVAKS